MKLTVADVKRVLQDDTFKEVLGRVRQQQIDIFVNRSRFDTEAIQDAKYMLTAIDKIEQAFQSVISEEAIKEKRKNLK